MNNLINKTNRLKPKKMEELIAHFNYTTLADMLQQLRDYKREFPNGDKNINEKILCVMKRMNDIYQTENDL